MDNFFNSMKQNAINDVTYNGSVTENGALGFKTTGKALLDLNFSVTSLRNATEDEIINKFESAYNENPTLAITWLFYARDIREGLGERRLFKVCFNHLFKHYFYNIKNEGAMAELISLVADFGRWDDIYSLCYINSTIDNIITNIFKIQLNKDIENMKNNKPVSLLAKWLKTETASSLESKSLAKWTMNVLGMKPREYRKTLSSLRKYIDVTEVKMSTNKWEDIDYSKVPSRASLLYKNAFTKHDEERYLEFINKVNKGEAKINAGTLFPHDIVSKYSNSNGWYGTLLDKIDETLEALWKNLPNKINDKNGSTLVVCDGSGSMMSSIQQGSSVTALNVSQALAIYFAERLSGAYKNKYITFSSTPEFVDISNCNTLLDKLREARRHTDVTNTNIEAVFNLILKTAVDNKCKQEDLPSNILIVSDMEFDSSTLESQDELKSLFQTIQDRFESKGYKVPRLVFWNVCSRTGTIPVTQNELGVALVSGFSPNVTDMVMSGELDPYKCLLNVLTSERYKDVNKLAKEIV